MIGKTVGHYRIDSKLGQGGMGVVYRATDSQLSRPVAIKLLRSDAVADSDRKNRFIQEAKAASALNHPNIVTIYHIGTEGTTDFIAMEYVSGRSLAQVIGNRPLPLADTLRYATQIAGALAAAHQSSIVHRDIKPGNIMVTDKGAIKLLDFGLAKLTEPAESKNSAAITTMSPETATGVIVGTVAYMSPEQANGTQVDARSDIYSLGVVLYEMISGRRPSGAEAAPDTTPRDLRKIVARCLQLDPGRRFQQMDDLRMALEDVDLSAEASAAPVVPAKRRWVLLATLLLLGAAAGTGVAWWLKPDRPLRGPVLTRVTTDSGLTTDPALSPDGKLVAYASDRSGEGNLDIWVQQIAGGGPVRLTHDMPDESEPSFSPDGSKIAFRSERDGGGVYVVSAVGGGDARRIADGGRRPRWSPDGKQIAYWTGVNTDFLWHIADSARIYVVNAGGGEPHRIVPGFSAARSPVWSSDGTHLIFLGTREPTENNQGEWWVTPLEAGSRVPVLAYDALTKYGLAPSPESSFVPDQWTSEGRVLFSARLGDSTNIWQVAVAASGQIIGPPNRLTAGTGLETNPSAATGGALVFSTHTNDIDLWSLPTETSSGKPAGLMKRLTQDPAIDFYPAFLPGNDQKLIFDSSRALNSEMLLKDITNGKEAVITAQAAISRPVVARDGSKVLFLSGPPYRWSALPLQGGDLSSSTPQTVCEECNAVWDISADNHWILHGSKSDSIIVAREFGSGKTTDFLQAPGEVVGRLQISPDDRWVAFNHRFGGAVQVIVAPFKPGTTLRRDQWIPITNGQTQDNFPVWSPASDMLYFISDADGKLCIWARRIDRSTGRPAGEAFPVWHFHEARRSMNSIAFPRRGLAVGRDHLVVNLSESSGNIWMATSPQSK